MARDGTEEVSKGLPSVVGRLARLVDEALPAGDVAELRRMSPETADAPAFWKLVATNLEPDGLWLAGTRDRDEAERRWATVLWCLAHGRGFHRPRAWAGAALADAGYAESRFVKLLRATGPSLRDEVRLAGRFLANKGTAVDFGELARLVFSDGTDDEDNVRRRLARSYFRVAQQ